MEPITDPYMLKPCLTHDGRPWTQRCFMCAKPVDFLKTRAEQRVHVGQLVRHVKCKNYLKMGPSTH
jgi:hypothetical protein